MGDQAMPLFVTQFYGKARSSSPARTRCARRANAENKLFMRFWGQVLYQVGLPSVMGSTSSRAAFALDRSEAVLGRPGSRSPGSWTRNSTCAAIQRRRRRSIIWMRGVAGEDAEGEPRPIPGRPGEYQVFLANDKPGRYELRVDNPEPTTFSYRVELPPRHQLEEVGLAERELMDLASKSAAPLSRRGPVEAAGRGRAAACGLHSPAGSDPREPADVPGVHRHDHAGVAARKFANLMLAGFSLPLPALGERAGGRGPARCGDENECEGKEQCKMNEQ